MKIHFTMPPNLKLSLCLFVMVLSFFGCEKVNVPEEIIRIENQEPTFTIKQYSREHIEKNTKLVSRLKKINDNLIEKKSAKHSEKEVYNEEYDFTIYTESATYIEDGDYHSYTFPIVQETDEKIKNIFFELNEENEYDAYLVKYDYSANELKYQDFNSLSMKTFMEPINLDFNSLFARTSSAFICFYTYTRNCCDNYVSGKGCGEVTGDDYYNVGCEPWVLNAGSCETVLYYDEDYKKYQQGNTATVTIGGTIYGSPRSSKTSPMPSPFDAEELMKINVVKDKLKLRNYYDAWLNSHGWKVFEIYDFLVKKLYSQEAIDFAKLAFKAMREGGKVDLDDNVILSKEFKDNVKLKCVYDKLAGDNNSLFRDTVGAFIDNPNVNLIFKIGDCSTGGAAGCTNSIYVAETGIITITIEDTDLSSVELAETILHESIHAELAKYVLEHDSTIDTNDKPRLFELYKFYRESGVPEKHIDHPYMALNYINPIASALSQFDNNKYPLDYYKSFAWIGLEDFDVNRVLTDPLINIYENYKATVIENSTICE